MKVLSHPTSQHKLQKKSLVKNAYDALDSDQKHTYIL